MLRYLIISLIVPSLVIGCSGGHAPVFVPEPSPPEPGTIPDDGSDFTARVDGSDEDTRLAEGHPIEGINYSRNNRSAYSLPSNLSGEDRAAPFYDNSYYGFYDYARFNDMVIDGDERIYLGRYVFEDEGIFPFYRSTKKNYDLLSFYFEGPVKRKISGGMRIVLTSTGIYTIDSSYSSSFSIGTGNDESFSGGSYSLVHFNDWPKIADEISTRWYYKEYYGYIDTHYDDDYRPFREVLPVPGGWVLVSYDDIDTGEPIHLQILTGSLVVFLEMEFETPITGFAHDEDTTSIFVSTETGLYCYDTYFVKKWDTLDSTDAFSDGIPVVLDDGYVAGSVDGVLRVVDSNGLLVAEKDCGALLRPAVLIDGTLISITDSFLVYFDGALNLTDEVPLPTGPDTGELYTRPPLVDANDNMALFGDSDLYIIDREGTVLAQRTFDYDIREIRLGPEHLFVALDYEIYRFPHG